MDGKVQHLSDIYPVIETNTILNKTITGIGATYSEIKAPRHSIIIEPTKPVIYGKTNDPKHKDDNLFGVFQGVYSDKIAEYIEKSIRQNKMVKILTTPESFNKVQDAFEELDIDIRFDGYFLLFDEVQKTIKDCDYRQDITLPMDLFFECRDKAIVSATPPNKFADSRFNDFTLLRVIPDFDYKRDMHLYTTNNVLQRTRELLNVLRGDERPVFLFVNSTDMIRSLMKQLQVKEMSAVFCSEKSVDKLRREGFKNAYEEWEVKRMARYNWLTSRFYSAFDIELTETPNVVMLTDCSIANYTMIDPYMDAVQIVGRFRNRVYSVYHVTNWDNRNPIRSKEQIAGSVQEMEVVYEYLGTLAHSAPSATQRVEFRKAQSAIQFAKFLDENGKVDPYKVDNYIDEETVKVTYTSTRSIQAAYEKCGYFNVTHSYKPYKFGDFERLKIEDKTVAIREKRKQIVSLLDMLGDCETEAEQQFKRDLAFADSLTVEAYDLLGKETIEHLKYSVTKIKRELILKKHQLKSHCTDTIELILAYFYPQRWYSASEIKKKLREIFKKMEVPTVKAITSHTINDYFEAVEEKRHTGRGYYLVAPRFL